MTESWETTEVTVVSEDNTKEFNRLGCEQRIGGKIASNAGTKLGHLLWSYFDKHRCVTRD